MTTEPTNQLPPCPLSDCAGGEHHYHNIDTYTIEEEGHDCAYKARLGYRCYSQHRPQSPQWEPIEHDQIKAGMRIKATSVWDDRITDYTGVAHRTDKYGDWFTEGNQMLTGIWGNSATYEVDSATYEVDSATYEVDPDAEPVEIIAELLHAGDFRSLDMWGGLTERERQIYRDQAREIVAAVRSHDEAVTGDE